MITMVAISTMTALKIRNLAVFGRRHDVVRELAN